MPPVVLGIDTSSAWCSVALLDDDRLCVRREAVGSAHSQVVLAMVRTVLREAGTTLAACDALAYACGPGSFTGLRVAAAIAQGLAYGAGLAVASIGTLDAIAHSVPGGAARRLLVAQDARMGEVYWACFERRRDGWARVLGPTLGSPSALRAALVDARGPGPIEVGCGNAWSVHGAALAGLVLDVIQRDAADAADVARLGAIAWRDGDLVAAAGAQPLYVRNDVARTTAERAAGRLVIADGGALAVTPSR